MISYIQDETLKVIAFIEWNRVNSKGQFDDNGDCLFMAEMWIHPDLRGGYILWELIGLVDAHHFTFGAKKVYWQRERHNDKVRVYKREFFKRRIENVKKQVV